MSDSYEISDTLQEKSDRTERFLARLDTFRVHCGFKIAETCRTIGISRSLFFELRNGNRDVTEKMESRLAIAEREAGLAAWTDTRLAAAKTPAEVENILADSTLEERLLNLEVGSYRWSMELQAAVMDSDIGISAFIKNAQELAGMAERFAASTKVASGHSKSLRTIAKKVSRQAHTISTQWCELFLALLSVADRIERETARGASQKQADET